MTLVPQHSAGSLEGRPDGVVRAAVVGAGMLFVLLLWIRHAASIDVVRGTYAAALLLAAAWMVLSVLTGPSRGRLPRDLHRYAIGMAAALVAGAMDAVSWLGDDRTGFAIAVMIGIPSLGIFLRRGLRMQSSTMTDRLDAALIGVAAASAVWAGQAQNPGMLVQAGILTLFAAGAAAFAAMVVLSSRQRRISPARILTALGLTCQCIGIVVAPDALGQGRYADAVTGSTLTMVGSLVLAGAVAVAFTRGPMTDDHVGRNIRWWGPMALFVTVVTSQLVLTDPPTSALPLLDAMTVVGAALLLTRIVLTVRSLERASAAVEGDRRRLGTLMADMVDVITVIDDDMRVRWQSRGAPNGLAPPGGLVGHKALGAIHPDDLPAAEAVIAAARAQPGTSHTWIGRARNARGELREVEAVVVDRTAVTDVAGLVVTFRDVSIRRRAERALEELALCDQLTGLLNRTGLNDHLEAQLRSAAPTDPVAVLFCDLDRLKVVNDSLGHDIGDRLIMASAARWSAVLDDIVGGDPEGGHPVAATGPSHHGALLARIGGDEFVLCYRPARVGLQPLDVAGRLHAALEQPIDIDGFRLAATTSIGVASAEETTTTPDALLRDADAALYRAKADGGNAIAHFDEGLRLAALERLELERDIRTAIEAGDVDVDLQPILDLRSGQVVSLEALLRWRHPHRGAVPPTGIIAVAEETGLIVPLGELLLDRSCAALAAVRHVIGAGTTIAVNTSASQLLREEYPDVVADALARHGLAPTDLVVEVTEQVLLDLDGRAGRSLARLHEAGVAISLDDFGTGYSSLSYLRSFPIDVLKLDRSFVTAAAEPVGAVVLNGILRIADALGIPVVAEGIETASQLTRLRDAGCALGQGYLLARPMTTVIAADWLRRHAASPLIDNDVRAEATRATEVSRG